MQSALGDTGALAARLGARLIGPSDVVILRFDTLDRADPSTLSFIRDARRMPAWERSRAGAALIPRALTDDPSFIAPDTPGRSLLAVDDPDLALALLLESVVPAEPHPVGVHPSASVDPSAALGEGVGLGPNVSIGPDVRIGDGTVIHANTTIGHGVRIGRSCQIRSGVRIEPRSVIGDGVILHPGVVIGADGFGYRAAPEGSGLVRIPHIGNVEIGDGVEIGANTCIDRAKFGSTRIGAGTKIDNLVQIGHNCEIGRCCIICGCAALAGSVRLGDGVTLAGGVAIADNREIGSGATIGARSGVMDDIPAKETWVGYPARPARTTLRIVAAMDELPDFLRRARKLMKGMEGA